MIYTPKTEEQLAEEALLPEGEYDFEVIDTSDKPSRKGNDMITLKLCVFSNDGTQRHIFDYIAEGHLLGERKLRHAAVACDLLDTYSTGSLTAGDFLNRSGKVFLKQQKGVPEFPLPKNVVADYLPRDNSTALVKPLRAKDIIDDDIPF